MPKTKTVTKSQVRKIAQAVVAKQTEVKHSNTGWTTSGFSDRPYAINPLDYISEGDGATKRDGNRINLLSMNVRSNLTLSEGSTRVRLYAVETREPLDSVLVGSTYQYDARPLFDSTASQLGSNNYFDMDTVTRVLFNKMVNLRSLYDGDVPIATINRYVKFGKQGKKCYYDGNSQTGSQIGTNTKTYVYLGIISDDASGQGAQVPIPQLLLNVKSRFTDA